MRPKKKLKPHQKLARKAPKKKVERAPKMRVAKAPKRKVVKSLKRKEAKMHSAKTQTVGLLLSNPLHAGMVMNLVSLAKATMQGLVNGSLKTARKTHVTC